MSAGNWTLVDRNKLFEQIKAHELLGWSGASARRFIYIVQKPTKVIAKLIKL